MSAVISVFKHSAIEASIGRGVKFKAFFTCALGSGEFSSYDLKGLLLRAQHKTLIWSLLL